MTNSPCSQSVAQQSVQQNYNMSLANFWKILVNMLNVPIQTSLLSIQNFDFLYCLFIALLLLSLVFST